jgi:large subunit ribosomal protein L31
MKEKIHPEWFANANVVCACGNTWVTGATIAEIRTDICSACHPFYTGEQRIVDTEGQVDRFIKRLQIRDNKRTEAEARAAARNPMNISLAEFDLEKRAVQLLSENNMNTVGEFIARIEADGDEKFLEIQGFGRQRLLNLKKTLRERGYDLPKSETSEQAE